MKQDRAKGKENLFEDETVQELIEDGSHIVELEFVPTRIDASWNFSHFFILHGIVLFCGIIS